MLDNFCQPLPECFWYERTFKGLDPISKPVHVDSAKECQAACKEAATEGECCDVSGGGELFSTSLAFNMSGL